jgi:hypothetical protein
MQQWENCVFYGVRSEEVFSLGSDQRLYISDNEADGARNQDTLVIGGNVTLT